jgi:hypothetical protein
MSKSEGWEALWARLTDEEREEAAEWQKPTDVDLGGGVVLRYDEAVKELEVGLNRQLEYCDADDPDLISLGHLDFAWDPVEIDGVKVAYVGDAKRSSWTAETDTLQLDAYGFAWASHTGADAYGAGLWILSDGQWRWRTQIVDLYSHEASIIATKLLAAALNSEDHGTTGPHCQGCYQRLKCPEHLIPAIALTRSGNESLKPFSTPGGLTDNATALGGLALYQSFRDLVDQMKRQLEAYAHQNSGISDGNGKVWKQQFAANDSEQFDLKRFKREHPDLAAQYVNSGKPRNMGFRWQRAR